MTHIVFFDTETTGLPDWKTPSGGENQPHIVELAAILANVETKKIVSTLDVIVKPDGWEISADMTEIHGISHDLALKVGVPEKLAVSMLFEMCKGAEKRVAHNRTFDQRIVRIAAKRYFSEEEIDLWAEKDDFDCTMLLSKPIMQMLPKGRFGYKNPKCEEAYEFFTGKKLEGAHNALKDTMACMEIYWGIGDFKTDENSKNS